MLNAIVVNCHLFGGVGEEVRRSDQVGLDVVLLIRNIKLDVVFQQHLTFN